MLNRLLRRLKPAEPAPKEAQPAPVAPAPVDASPAAAPGPRGAEASADVQARARRLAERLLEDERLRGELDDATWQPVQDWLLRAAERIAAATDGLEDAAAQPRLDAGQAALKEVATTLADALATGTGAADFAARLEPLHHLLRPPLVESAQVRRVHAALRDAVGELTAEHADGPTAAARLVAALEAGTTPAGSQA